MPTTDYDFHAHFFGDNRRLMTDAEKNQLHAAISAAAECHDPEGMMLLGRLYYEGFTVAQDYTAARRWFERADAAGDSWGTVCLTYCYYYGRELPVNYPRAHALFVKAAKMGNHCALYDLDDMARDELSVPVDLPRALACCREALARITPAVPEYPNIAARIGHLSLPQIEADLAECTAILKTAVADLPKKVRYSGEPS
ncbi:hypothetical protein [Pseudoramibacter faecis]|uniref:tetratricopeptide repeat protein n=1 Tax=Pseudoramibacter faecis TaxID=3108534 RepID=UPI002E762E34|nr:hypothetical protein [Pseudoramibacter sp. HA2172]